MKFYWIKTHFLIKKIFSGFVWDFPTTEKKVYLTFDDGPTPEVTEWTLDQLKLFDAKATFFCIGENIQKHPKIFQKLVQEGHSIGNHTFNHLNGWKTSTENYIENFKQCEAEILEQFSILHLKSKLFRPPYGKIKFSQSKIAKGMGYKIIMWDVLSADFDTTVSPEKCLQNVIKNVKSGSVIIFHDSLKASKNLEHALPKTLAFLKENGYKCEAI